MKVAVAGGVPIVLCDAPDGRGGTWSPSGTIVFSPTLIFDGLAKVSANGGAVEPVTLLDLNRGENSHRWPVFLPDGVHVLFHVRASADERRGVYVARIDRPASIPGSPLFRSESEAVFVPTSGRERGVLLSAADGQLQARPFDAAALRLIGDPRTLAVAVGREHAVPLGDAECIAGICSPRWTMPMPYGVQLGTVARDGTGVRLSAARQQGWPRLSPDGRRMARQMIDPARGNPDIWVEDLLDGTLVRVTTCHRYRSPSGVVSGWTAAGIRIRHSFNERRLSIASADGTGVTQELPCPGSIYCEPTDWSPDGRASHRQHTPGHEQCARRCMERVAHRRGFGRGDSLRVVPRVRCAAIAGRAVAGLRLGGDRPTGSVRSRHVGSTEASRRVQQTAAANPSGAAMDERCSTSISRAIFAADRWNANREES